mgnify:CR=1 FL=1
MQLIYGLDHGVRVSPSYQQKVLQSHIYSPAFLALTAKERVGKDLVDSCTFGVVKA